MSSGKVEVDDDRPSTDWACSVESRLNTEEVCPWESLEEATIDSSGLCAQCNEEADSGTVHG